MEQLPEGLSWEDASDGRSVPHAIVAGETSDGKSVWIARSEEDCEIPVGYLIHGEQFARLPYFGRTIRRNTYQILSNPGDVDIDWRDAKLGQVSETSVIGGRSSKNEPHPIYVCRVTYKNSILPAKLVPRAKRCFVAYNGREIARREYQTLNVCSKPRYFDTHVADTPAPHGLQWVSVSTKDGCLNIDQNLRKSAIRLAFLDDSKYACPTYVIRASLPRQLVPGGWQTDADRAYVSYFGYTVFCNEFQLLRRTSSDVQLFWSEAYQNDIPDDALLAGKDEHGHPVYIARSNIDGNLVAGKVIPASSKAFFAHGMHETTRQTYQILCMHLASANLDNQSQTDFIHSSQDCSTHVMDYDDRSSSDAYSLHSSSKSQSRRESAEKYESGDSFKVGHVDTQSEGFISATRSQFEIPNVDRPQRLSDDFLLTIEDENTPFLLVSTDFSGYASQLRQQERQRRTCGRFTVLVITALVIIVTILVWAVFST